MATCSRWLVNYSGESKGSEMQNAVALAALVVIVSVFMPRTVAQDKATPPAYRTSAALDVLRSDSSLEAKYEACRQLARRGDERAVPLLGELLADEQLSHMARYALEPMPFSSVDDVFREALTRLKGDLLIGVIHSIGVRGDGPAAGKVGELIQDPNPGVANAAAKALGQIAAAECVPVLQRVLATATGDRRTSVADACLRCAGGRLRRGDSQGATRLFDALRAANVPKHHVLAGIRGSILARGMDGLPLLFELLESDDRAMRGLGMRVAGELPGAELCEALADTMSTLRPEAQLLLVQVFQDRADAAAHGAIKRAARSNSPVVRVAALRALGELGDASCVSLLIDAAGAAERPDESAAAWMSLCRIPVPGVAAAVVAAMSSAEPGLRVKLIEVLEARKASAAVEHLLEEARSANAGVSTAAFSALAVLARPVDVPALASLLVRCPHVSAREEALRAVSSAAARIDDVSRRGDAVLALLATTQDGAARCQLLQALGRIGNFQAFDTLRSALNGTDTRERDIALRSLANWHDATPASLLVRLAADTEDRVHRTLALRGVIRMAGLVAADCEQPSTQVLQWFSEANRVAIGPDEKKLVLSGLARLGHPSALAMASGCLDDPDVQSEAGLALVGIASTLGDLGHRDAAETALDKVMATVKDPTVRKQVEKALRGLQVSTEYIHAWQICGPYTQKGKQCQQLYGVAFPPEKTDGKADWRQLNRSIGGGGKMTEVGPTFPGNHRAAYVRTWLMSAGEQRARLELGFDDGGKVWLNGEVVCEANTAGACVPGAHQADVYQANRSPSRKLRMPSWRKRPPASRSSISRRSISPVPARSIFWSGVGSRWKKATTSAASIFMKMA